MERDPFFQKFHIRLNEQQRTAVETVDGPVLLLAVPGSGKTTVLVARLGYMVFVRGIAPKNILTLTYTVAATRDMSRRFARYFGEEMAGRLEFRTINGICSKIISLFGRAIGRTPFRLVADEKENGSMLGRIFQEVTGKRATESDLKVVRTLITCIKNGMSDEEEIAKMDEAAGFEISEIYRRYCAQMRAERCMDYDDQMIYARMILLKYPQVLAYFQEMYQYICVDEAQDTSRIQHEIIALLAGKRHNLFMVGDEDQSIYGFRAAYPQALLTFGDRYPEAKILLMEENYRSNARIVAAADRFIRGNILRHEKTMAAARPAGAEIRFIALRARGAQYTYLAKVAASLAEKRAAGGGQKTAVLCRDNESMIPLIDLLERGGTPFYLRRADPAFFSHRVVRDIRNIIAFSRHMDDPELFLQIYYRLGIHLYKNLAVSACREAARTGADVISTVLQQIPYYLEDAQEALLRVRDNLIALRSDTAAEAMNRIMGVLGYGSFLKQSGMDEGKIKILYFLAGRESSAERLVARLDELQDFMQNRENPENCSFILSTIHASKGLEYDTVYLMDTADGIFPQTVPKPGSGMSQEERNTWEEERRLFYVGITRAKDYLNIFEFGQDAVFIEELKEAAGMKEPAAEENPGVTQLREMREYRRFVDSLTEGLAVVHAYHGSGVVVRVEEPSVWVSFDRGIQKMSLPILFKKKLLTEET